MLSQQLRRALALLFLILGGTLFAWGVWPAMKANSRLTLLPEEMQLTGSDMLPAQISRETPVPAILEVRQITLEAPRFLRVGDKGAIKLSFVPHNAPVDTGGLGDIFDSHQVAVEARLVMGGLQVRPTGILQRALVPGHPLTFEWDFLPLQAGTFQGTAWFYLRFMPKAGGHATSQLLSAQRLSLQPRSFWGLSGPQSRLAGGACLLLSLFLAVQWPPGNHSRV
jgi:hypothetical protein